MWNQCNWWCSFDETILRDSHLHTLTFTRIMFQARYRLGLYVCSNMLFRFWKLSHFVNKCVFKLEFFSHYRREATHTMLKKSVSYSSIVRSYLLKFSLLTEKTNLIMMFFVHFYTEACMYTMNWYGMLKFKFAKETSPCTQFIMFILV